MTLPAMAPALNTRFFTPPPVSVGQIVLWWAYGERENHLPLPAIVISVGTRTIELAVFKSLVRSHDTRDGVRHITDPDARRDEFVEMGAWSYTAETERLNRVEEKMKYLGYALGIESNASPDQLMAAAKTAEAAVANAKPAVYPSDLEDMPKDEEDS